jgi:cytochrome c biogenesis protein CcmG/thiol:disulfide interchange protein DsbE
MKRLIYFAPVIGFLVLAYFLFGSLSKKPDALPSVLIGKPVPAFALTGLDKKVQGFGPQDMARGRVTLVNVWASWCAPCREEAPMLKKIATTGKVALFGFVWKDKPEKARAFLDEVGNPFERIGIDQDGRVAMEWGVYGVPETYVIDRHGIVRDRFTGALTPEREAEVWTAIARAESF